MNGRFTIRLNEVRRAVSQKCQLSSRYPSQSHACDGPRTTSLLRINNSYLQGSHIAKRYKQTNCLDQALRRILPHGYIIPDLSRVRFTIKRKRDLHDKQRVMIYTNI
jgi:hypothetical protein